MTWIKIAIDEVCHVSWSVRQADRRVYLHAIGDGERGNRVTDEMARMRFDKSRLYTPWIPVLFPSRVVTLESRSINCATAAARAAVRGWFWIP